MACLRSVESVKEFISAETSSDAVIGIYTLIGNSVVEELERDIGSDIWGLRGII